jgi:hypothetical protein
MISVNEEEMISINAKRLTRHETPALQPRYFEIATKWNRFAHGITNDVMPRFQHTRRSNRHNFELQEKANVVRDLRKETENSPITSSHT